MPMPKTSPRAAGFLAIEDTKDEKIFPIPIPTPTPYAVPVEVNKDVDDYVVIDVFGKGSKREVVS